ncbi:MAG TPA: PASTA domain-containing protein [Streptosporangiaceae bacterium]|nr:PASTA domain-containing protein [Streptosporangiaceae bacterium]
MATSARERLMRVALGLVLVAGAVAVAFGTGYRASNALLDGASAYVQKDHTIVRVNAESRETDAEVAKKLAGRDERLAVVQVRPGVVYVVNTVTGAVWRLPTDTLKPEPVRGGERQTVPNPPQTVYGGGRTYLFDKMRGTLTLLEDSSGRGRQDIKLPEPPTQVVVDGSGVAWALSQQVGDLYGVADGSVVARHHVAGPWEPALLTLAGNRPIVYRPERGVATMFDRSRQVRAIELPKERTWRGVYVAAPGADSRVLVVASQASGELTAVDFTAGTDGGTGRTRRTRLAAPAAHQFGAAVVSRGRIYVPDYTNRRVVVLESRTLRRVRSVVVHGGTQFELFERDGRVWVNDPYDDRTLSFDRDGRPVTIDKTEGGLGEPGRSNTPRPAPNPPSPPPTRESVPPHLPPRPPSEPAPSSAVAPEPTPATTRVPNLVGKTVDEAHRALRAARLRWRDEIGGVVRTGADVGRVVRQTPRGAARAPVGGVVTIWRPEPSQGSPIEVPNLIGLTADQACQTLQAITLGCAGTAVPHPTATGVHSQNPGAGVRVSSGTTVGYLYQDFAPQPLNRFRADRVKSRYLSLSGGPVGDGVWHQQPPSAGVYAPGAIGPVPGLVAVYQAGCGNCDVQTVYYYANADGRTPAQPNGLWVSLSGAEFACFHQSSAPPGTVPLMRMSKGVAEQKRWEFAPKPSQEYGDYVGNGFAVDKDLCYVWPR